MRRFNFDELIWFIVLAMLNCIFLYLIKTKLIYNFIDEDSIIYMYIGIVILFVFLIFQLKRIFTIPSRKEITLKFIPLIFIIIVCIINFLVMPLIKVSDSKITSDAITINNNNFEMMENLNIFNVVYGDKLINISAFIYSMEEDNLILARELIDCCHDDRKYIKIRVKGIEGKRYQWYSVTGEVKHDSEGWYIEAKEYTRVNEPKDRFFKL